jgi:hypothetical protein
MAKPVQKVLTVRVPQDEHAALRAEAYKHQLSMNELCRIKLREPIDPIKVPPPTWAQHVPEADNGKDIRHLAEPFTRSED